MEDYVKQIIGKKVKLGGSHPWRGHLAKIIGWDDRLGMRVSLISNDAADGLECYVRRRNDFRTELR